MKENQCNPANEAWASKYLNVKVEHKLIHRYNCLKNKRKNKLTKEIYKRLNYHLLINI